MSNPVAPFTNKDWFSEASHETGSAFSLEIRRKLGEEQTPYQKIEVWETAQWGNLMAIDGYVMLSARDNFLSPGDRSGEAKKCTNLLSAEPNCLTFFRTQPRHVRCRREGIASLARHPNSRTADRGETIEEFEAHLQ